MHSFKLKFTRQLTVLALKINLGTVNVSYPFEKPLLLRKCELEASESVTQHLIKTNQSTRCLKTLHEEAAAALLFYTRQHNGTQLLSN